MAHNTASSPASFQGVQRAPGAARATAVTASGTTGIAALPFKFKLVFAGRPVARPGRWHCGRRQPASDSETRLHAAASDSPAGASTLASDTVAR